MKLKTKRYCFTSVADTELENHYRVAKVYENKSGYYPLGKSKPDNHEVDKFVSEDGEHIQRICDQFNDGLNVTKDDIDQIVHSSVRLQFNPWEADKEKVNDVNKEQVKWYFEETFHDYWEVIADFLNSDNETKEIMKADIQNQTKGRNYK